MKKYFIVIILFLLTGCAATKKFVPECNRIYVYLVDERRNGKILTYIVTEEYKGCKCIYYHKQKLMSEK